MDNPEKLATRRGNQEWTIQRNWQHEGQSRMDNPEKLATNTQGQSRMDNPEKLATFGAHNTRRRQTIHKTTTEKTKKMSKTDPPESGVNTGPHEGYAVPAFQNDHSEFVSTTGYRGLLQDI
jgi:hypothetical protein